jgi:hypothetical protein
MKYKLAALVMALAVMSWAQTATQPTPTTPQQSTAPADKAKCPCCDKMAAADTKDAPACCAHHGKHSEHTKDMASCGSGKDGMSSCCSGKDAKSCMKGDKDKAGCCGDSCAKDKTAAGCCGDKCGKDGDKGCCSSKKSETTAKSCCKEDLRSQNDGQTPVSRLAGRR